MSGPGLLHVFVNKVLLEHSHTHLFSVLSVVFLPLWQSLNVEKETI